MGTQTCVSRPLMIAVRRSRTRAVTALKLESHDPQSRSIAVLVASEVARGPGVSKMGSRSTLLIGLSLTGARLSRGHHIVTGRRHACVRVRRKRVTSAYKMHMVVDAATINVAIAAAGPISPASSRMRIASEASCVSGAYRNTTADMVTIALMKRYRAMSSIAGRHTGTVTRKKVL